MRNIMKPEKYSEAVFFYDGKTWNGKNSHFRMVSFLTSDVEKLLQFELAQATLMNS